jgi:putative acetyltransferase
MPASAPSTLAEIAVVRPAGLDDWSDIRQLHKSAFEALTGPLLDEEIVLAMQAYLSSTDYTEDLQAENVAVACVDGHIVGTCGWVPSDDAGQAARITALYVDPLFVRLGLGRRLTLDAEARARAAGFHAVTTRATDNAVEFFLSLGYEIASQGVTARASDLVLPVTFMRKREPARQAMQPPAPASPEA